MLRHQMGEITATPPMRRITTTRNGITSSSRATGRLAGYISEKLANDDGRLPCHRSQSTAHFIMTVHGGR